MTAPPSPRRVQLSRKRGWQKPENTVVVARPSKWGNPVRIVPVRKRGPFDLERDGVGFIGQNTDLEGARRSAVARYRDLLLDHPHLVPVTVEQIRAELRGKNLACWCPLDQPCHADVLLEIANEPLQSEVTAERIDPDCRDGKHPACPGWTWDTDRDAEAPCACPCHTAEKEAR